MRRRRNYATRWLTDPTTEAVPLGIVVASLGALAIAYIAQYGFDLAPCPLCLWQRLPYAVAAGLGIVSLMVESLDVRALLMAAAGIAFAIGAAIAVYHFGVEQHWWASAVCGGKLPAFNSAADLAAALNRPPPPGCDKLQWTVFGISITAYNALISLLLAAFALTGALRLRLNHQRPARGPR